MEVNYIIGIGRSGTSLLTSLMNSHPNVSTVPENYFVTFFYSAFKSKTKFYPKHLKMIHEFNLYFEKLQPYRGYVYDLNKVNNFIQKPFSGSYHELCIQFYSFFTHVNDTVSNSSMIIDKNPSNTLYVKELLDLNPQAKFILITRDYRANILSRIESVHIRSKSVIYNAIRWNFFMQYALMWKKKYNANIHTIKYEDLVVNPQHVINEICSFLNLKHFDISTAHEEERKAYVLKENDKNDRLVKKYSDLSKPISTSRINAWENNLSSEEIKLSEKICGETGAIWDYLPTSSKEKRGKVSTSFLLNWLRVKYELTKDRIVFFFPISWKLKRFKKFVNAIELKRNERTK